MDDLTVLEKINFRIVGLSSFYSKVSVPSDVAEHNQIIPAECLRSQEYLDKIKQWTDDQKTVLNQKKTKLMVFNYTDNYQFSTRLQLNNENVEIVKYARLLGVIISDNLSWDKNTSDLVKRSNARMELMRKVAGFSTSIEEKKKNLIELSQP